MDSATPNWRRQGARPLPGPRFGAGFFQSPTTGVAVLFAGLSPWEGQLNDTWLLRQDDWHKKERFEILPPARRWMGISHDHDRRLVVLFGGDGDESLLGDVWTFDGEAWMEQHPSSSPSPRAKACMAYDPVHKHTLLFGGAGAQGRDTVLLSDTWIWDGASWAELLPAVSPPARFGACVAYDGAHGAVILFGGCGHAGLLDDTWAWNGSSWLPCGPGHRPCPRVHAAMAYDESNQEVLLFGGQSPEQGAMNDTWVWDGQDWVQMEPEDRPPVKAGFYPQLAYDSRHKSIVLFATIQNKEVTPSGVTYDAWSEVWLWH